MIESRRIAMRRRTAVTFPCVQSDMVMIAAGGEERRLASVTLREFESQHITIERNCALEVGDLQMNMADADLRVNWLWLLLLHCERSLNELWLKRKAIAAKPPEVTVTR